MNDEQSTAIAERPMGGPKELIAIPPESLLITHAELRLMYTIAQTVIPAAGQAVPKGIDTPAKAMAVMLAGWELGFRPMTSLRHLHIINGRTEPDAQAMQALVLANDASARFEWHDYSDTLCDVTLHRAGRAPVRVSYSLDDAKRSGQAAKQGPWKEYTRDMLAWSAVKRCCRLGAPDLINFGGASVASVQALAQDIEPLELGEAVEVAAAAQYNPGDEPDDSDGQPSLALD